MKHKTKLLCSAVLCALFSIVNSSVADLKPLQDWMEVTCCKRKGFGVYGTNYQKR